jgi:signal transduction histidine kinase
MSVSPPTTERTFGVEAPTPLPPGVFARYVSFWHVLYLGLLAVLLGYVVWTAWPALVWRHAALALLVAGQAALYVVTFIRPRRWPRPGWWMAGYFLGSLALWYLEWQLDERFFWLIMSYFGQMFGTLPPIAAVPGMTLIYVFVTGQGAGWDFLQWPVGELTGVGMGWASFIVVYWFIYRVSRTSEERAGLIRELRAAQAALEAARQRDAELAALRERERLARDLHDSLGHALVSITVQLEAIQRLYRVDAERAAGQVEALKGVTRAAMDELRRSLQGLRAPGLGERPLAEALHALSVETGQRTGLEVACSIDGETGRLSPVVAETLWRVAQEALTNAARHAQARHAAVRLRVTPSAAVLRVQDDGRGLAPGAGAPPGHFGLAGLRERVEGVGGELVVEGQAGVVVEARVPIV